MAHAEELGDAIRMIRSRGKKVICHLEDGGGRALHVCSQADRIFLNPAGGVRFSGLKSQYLYFGGLLEKLGVRAEFGASEADEDPRVLALEGRIGALNARLFDELHGALGIHADLTTSVWDPGADEEVDDDASPADVQDDTFTLDYVVMTHPGGPDLDDVVGLLDRWGHEARERLVEAGYAVPEWGVGRGADDDHDPVHVVDDTGDDALRITQQWAENEHRAGLRTADKVAGGPHARDTPAHG